MADGQSRGGDPLTRALGIGIALGALAFGAVAAIMNSERTRQMRDDLERQIQDLNRKLETALAERRPDIEQAIEKSRQVAVQGLDRVKGVVEEGADRAHEYVQRATVTGEQYGEGSTSSAQAALPEAGEAVSEGRTDTTDTGTGFSTNGDGPTDDQNVSNNPGY